MGYPDPLTPTLRRFNEGVFLASTAFGVSDKLQFGNRMAIINIPDTKKLLIWSALPVGEAFDRALNAATDGKASEYEIAAAVIPNVQHTLAIPDLKKRYPHCLVIGPPEIKSGAASCLDYEFKIEDGNTVVNGSKVATSLGNFDFVLLKAHKNKELVLLDKKNKTLFESDVLLNVPWDGKNEDQYPGVNQNAGMWGFLTMGTNPDTWFGRYIFTSRLYRKTPEACEGMMTLMNLDFDSCVLSHGNVIETDAKSAFRKVFSDYLE